MVEQTETDETDYLAVGSSKLRTMNTPDLSTEARYAGRKVSRAKRAKDRGDEEEDKDEDLREHAAAELGHMFEFGDEEAEDEEEGAEEVDEDEGSGDTSESDDDLEEEEGDTDVEEAKESYIESEKDQEEPENGFVFDKNLTDFSQFGGDDDENGSYCDDSEDGSDSDADDIEDKQEHPSDPMVGNIRALEDEVDKGRAVQQQVKVWDRLLETRIQQQKLLTRINKLPVHQTWNRLTDGRVNTDFQMQIKQSQKALKQLLNELLLLEAVLGSRDESGQPPAKRRKLEEFSQALEDNHQTFVPVRNQVIEKWNDKTRISAGKNAFSSLETSTLMQIEQILANKPRLVARTQLKRSSYRVLGAEQEQVEETDVNVFDDDDFLAALR